MNSQMETTILTNQLSTIVTSSVFFGLTVAYLAWYIHSRNSRHRRLENGGRRKTKK